MCGGFWVMVATLLHQVCRRGELCTWLWWLLSSIVTVVVRMVAVVVVAVMVVVRWWIRLITKEYLRIHSESIQKYTFTLPSTLSLSLSLSLTHTIDQVDGCAHTVEASLAQAVELVLRRLRVRKREHVHRWWLRHQEETERRCCDC